MTDWPVYHQEARDTPWCAPCTPLSDWCTCWLVGNLPAHHTSHREFCDTCSQQQDLDGTDPHQQSPQHPQWVSLCVCWPHPPGTTSRQPRKQLQQHPCYNPPNPFHLLSKSEQVTPPKMACGYRPAQMITSAPPHCESVSVAAVHAPLESCLGKTATDCSGIHATTLNGPNLFYLLSRGEQVASPKMKCGCPRDGAQKNWSCHTCTPLTYGIHMWPCLFKRVR